MFPSLFDEIPYAWIITRDFTFDDNEFCSHLEMYYDDDNDYVCVVCNARSEAGVSGPRDIKYTRVQIGLALSIGRKWRMYDDDGILCYEGYIWVSNGEIGGDADFAPLDDFGAPNAGATDIKYLHGCTWISL